MKEKEQNRHVYPSDITRAQYEKIRNILENYKKRTRPREVNLYDVFCGILICVEK